MKVYIKRIPPEGEQLTGADPAAIMELDEPDVHFQHEVRHDLFVHVQGDALLVTGKVETPVTLRCSRCLRVFDRPLRVKQFVVHQQLQGEDFVDLTPQIREDIILELPQRALCSESCKGLCPSCGADLNEGACRCPQQREDGHWHALDQLKLK